MGFHGGVVWTARVVTGQRPPQGNRDDGSELWGTGAIEWPFDPRQPRMLSPATAPGDPTRAAVAPSW
ncbi:MAG: hypothetical protein ACKOFW_02670, partial [Planctomycetaceae bacterium]